MAIFREPENCFSESVEGCITHVRGQDVVGMRWKSFSQINFFFQVVSNVTLKFESDSSGKQSFVNTQTREFT